MSDAIQAIAQSPPGGLRIMSRARGWAPLSWLGSPYAYAACSPVLSVLGAGTMLVAPRLLSPAAFGEFALLNSLFVFAGRSDLGLSQMADRDLAGSAGPPGCERAEELVRAFWVVGLATLVVLVPLCALAAYVGGMLSPLDVTLAIAAGTAGMVAAGPVSVHRARSRIWEFTSLALLLQAGMTAPRLAGLVAGGVTGCFLAMLAWFGAIGALVALPALRSSRRAPIAPLVRAALPMFVFGWLWLLYVMANRWVSAALSSPEEFGLFAFGANLSSIAIGIVGTVAQVRYPRFLAMAGKEGAAACGRHIERDALMLGAALAAGVAVTVAASGYAVDALFPRYAQGAAATAILAISCVPLGIAAWFMPVLIATSPSPVRDAGMTLGTAFAVMVAGMAAGEWLGGIDGQAWGCVAASLALSAGMTVTMARLGLVCRARALRMSGLAVALVGALSAAFALTTAARAEDVAVPPSGWSVAFEDRFEALRLWDRSGGTWQPFYPWGDRTNRTNDERQYYVDPRPGRDPEPLRRLQPFATGPRGLVITGRPLDEEGRRLAGGLSYASGMLSTARSFSFTYGYVEIEARVPRGKGAWPAFWLLPTEGGWPPEIDVFEVLGDDVDGYWATLHTSESGKHGQAQRRVLARDLSAGFHAYGLLWTKDEIAWYLDGRRVFATPTPADLRRPMYLLLNLAIGGKWPGLPDASTPFPSELAVRRVSVHVEPPRGAKGAMR